MKLWQQVTQAHTATGHSTRLRDRQAAIVFYTLCIPIACAWKGVLDIQTKGAETSLFAEQNFDILYEKVSAKCDVSAPLNNFDKSP